MKRLWRVLLNSILGLKCDRCGKRGARLVIETSAPRVTRIDAKTHRKESVRYIKRMEVVCRNCDP